MFEKVKEILVEELQLNPDDVTLEADLSKDLNINSIEFYELMDRFEEKLGVQIAEDATDDFETVGDVVEYLEKL